ncbi:MAG: glycine cleavage system aminomethyltransferase GcvT [Magnetococcales bacterium]|nr:glycine cleavage system aminomethyltransferase GcvT [Magnetococcales bacterium]
MNRTSLFERHQQLKARIAPFGGWEMPIDYGSQIKEHKAVRERCGLFDVSHMGVVDLHGPEVELFLRYLLSNDVARIPEDGRAQYTLMLNEQGGVVDDLIVYRMATGWFRLVVNAGGRDRDMAWIRRWMVRFKVTAEMRDDLGLLALQGPESDDRLMEITNPALGEQAVALKPFHALMVGDVLIARTGYTGERGFEISAPREQIERIWDGAMEAGVQPVGLGARDTLRLEAGYNLYGSDMDQETSPLATGLGWVVCWDPEDRLFIGRTALEAERLSGSAWKRLGVVLEGRGVLRDGQELLSGEGDRLIGLVTSGSFSPMLGKGIGLARLRADVKVGDLCQVNQRGRKLTAKLVKPPFIAS